MKYKSHDELDITFAEFGALLGTRAMLETKILRHEPDGCIVDDVHGFDMGTAVKLENCGSVSCIGGTMAIIMGYTGRAAVNYVLQRDPRDHMESPLGELFFPGTTTGAPRTISLHYSKIKPKDAIRAIDNWLRGNRKPWSKKLLRDLVSKGA